MMSLFSFLVMWIDSYKSIQMIPQNPMNQSNWFLKITFSIHVQQSKASSADPNLVVSETKRGNRDASEYHPNHSYVEWGGSKTHPVGPPAASCQHPVLKNGLVWSDQKIGVTQKCVLSSFAWTMTTPGCLCFCTASALPLLAPTLHQHLFSDLYFVRFVFSTKTLTPWVRPFGKLFAWRSSIIPTRFLCV